MQFLLANLLVAFSCAITFEVLGINDLIPPLWTLPTIFLWGLVGSTWFSMRAVKNATEAMELIPITLNSQNAGARQAVKIAKKLLNRLTTKTKIKLTIWESQTPNSFSVGPTKSKALLALSTALLARMSESEIESVIAHEISKVINGSTAKMTWLQSLLNSYSFGPVNLICALFPGSLNKNPNRGAILLIQLLQLALMFMSTLYISWFHRKVLYSADYRAARSVSVEATTLSLRHFQEIDKKLPIKTVSPRKQPFEPLMFHSSSRLSLIFASHPTLEERIKKMEESYHLQSS